MNTPIHSPTFQWLLPVAHLDKPIENLISARCEVLGCLDKPISRIDMQGLPVGKYMLRISHRDGSESTHAFVKR